MRDSRVILDGLIPPETSADAIAADSFITEHGRAKIMAAMPRKWIYKYVADTLTMTEMNKRLKCWGWVRPRGGITKKEQDFEIEVRGYARKNLLPIRKWMLTI